MRLRSIFALSAGAAIGAGAMYLFDPDHGPQRRRDARRAAVREAAHATADLGVRAIRHVGVVADAAVRGFEEARTG